MSTDVVKAGEENRLRTHYLISGLTMASGVILGAFGAHALADALPPGKLSTFEIGVRYQLVHGLAILALTIGGHAKLLQSNRIIWLFLTGVVLFSGSLYLLATADLTGISTQIIGPLTPIGGIFFIIGWLWLIFTPKNFFTKAQ